MTSVQRARWLSAAATAASILAVIAATSAYGASQSKPISGASAFVLPSAKHCVKPGAFTIRVRQLSRVTWLGATVKINGKAFMTIVRSQITKAVTLTHLPSGKFVFSITAKARGGRKATATRTYRTCGPTQIPPPAPGSYSGRTSQGWYLAFYVSADRKQVQDITIQHVDLGCTPGGTRQDQSFNIPATTISAIGTFTIRTPRTGIVDSAPAMLTDTFSGRFRGTNVAGTFREDVTYNNGAAYKCTSNSQSWSMARDAQGAQTASPPAPGSYSGRTSQGWYVAFYVSADSSQVQDITIQHVDLGCTPGGTRQDQSFSIPAAAISADGSFTGDATQTGVIDTTPAQITFTFSGHFHGTDTAGTPRAAGTMREDISYDNGTAYTCTSNSQSWSVARDAQGAQTGPPAPGSYSGRTSQGWYVTFTVSADSKQVQNITIQSVNFGCTPSGSGVDRSFNIPAAAIGADGSFSISTVQDGVVGSAPAKYTYAFSGHFHGFDSSGVARAAGMFREDVTYNDGTAYTCTSNNQSWSASG